MFEDAVIRSGPVVCAVDDNYMICIPMLKSALVEVTVGEKTYYDHINGIRRSDTPVQKIKVPMKDLDAAGEYCVSYCEVIERKPYECIKKDKVTLHFDFTPISSDKLKLCCISDCHGMKQEAIDAGGFFGNDLDLLILNGDIASSCATEDEIFIIYDIAYSITKGELPCIITRGNHDLRGKLSEKLTDYMPEASGKTYYSVKFNNTYFLVLDCGEDKNDDNKEYSGTAAFRQMRLDESDFIKNVLSSEASLCDRYSNRIVLSHIPFYYRDMSESDGETPFNIEEEIYSEWTDIINKKFLPTMVLAGHLHTSAAGDSAEKYNDRKIKAPVVVGGIPNHSQGIFTGIAIEIADRICTVYFTDNTGNITEKEHFDL